MKMLEKRFCLLSKKLKKNNKSKWESPTNNNIKMLLRNTNMKTRRN